MKNCLIFLISFILLAKCSDFNFPSESDDESDFNKKYDLKREKIELTGRSTVKPDDVGSSTGTRSNFVAPIICAKGFMFDNRLEECRKVS